MGARARLRSRASVAGGLSLAQLRPLGDLSVIVVACAYGMILAFAVGLGVFGAPIIALVVLSVWSYAYTVLRCVAQGRKELPAPGWNTMNPVGHRVLLLHFGLFAVLLVFLVGTPWLEDARVLRFSSVALVACFFPASAVLMGLTYDLTAAFHPGKIVEVVRTLGRRYVLLIAGCLGLVACWLLVTAVTGLLRLWGLVLSVWTMLAVFALIGAVVRSAREELEIPGDVDTERARRAERDTIERWQRVLDHAYASIRSDLVAEGYRTIRELIDAEGHSAELHEWLLGRMLEWQEPQHVLEVAAHYIERLLAQGEPHRALDVYERCRKLRSHWTLPRREALALAEHARCVGRMALAEELAQT